MWKSMRCRKKFKIPSFSMQRFLHNFILLLVTENCEHYLDKNNMDIII